MIRIETNTLEEAYAKATQELGCSITEISIMVVQNPSSGFLGMFKKTAIIEASHKNEKPHKEKFSNKHEKPKLNKNKQNSNKNTPHVSQEAEKKVTAPLEEKKRPARKPRIPKETKPKIDVNKAVEEIRKEINNLFTHSCFSLEAVVVEAFNENTVLVEFTGEDAALLIGKEGYRYKALSYLLYNWINVKYGLNVRLEIAEFLKNQEEMIEKYLLSVVERINNTGRAQTKILDGVLVKIALESLRKQFPDKYVGIKSGREGGKFVVINDFNRKKA